MEMFNKLVILAQREPPGNLPLLAQTLGFPAEVVRHDTDVMDNIDEKTLVALAFAGSRLDRHGLPPQLRQLMAHVPVFLYQAESRWVDPRAALMMGIRGIIPRDEQLDNVLFALKILMQGELYYSRKLLSSLVDNMLRQRQEEGMDPNDMTAMMSLTRQERRIIELVAEGARNKEIAYSLNISAHTVKAHLSSIFRKTQARNRVELLRWAQQLESPHRAMTG